VEKPESTRIMWVIVSDVRGMPLAALRDMSKGRGSQVFDTDCITSALSEGIEPVGSMPSVDDIAMIATPTQATSLPDVRTTRPPRSATASSSYPDIRPSHAQAPLLQVSTLGVCAENLRFLPRHVSLIWTPTCCQSTGNLPIKSSSGMTRSILRVSTRPSRW
jgi:hypothetical protein